MALSCMTSERKRDIGRKSRLCILRPRQGEGPRLNIVIVFGKNTGKDGCVASWQWKEFEDIFIAVSTGYRRVTDRRTDL